MYKIINHLYVGPISMLDFAREFSMSILGACKYPLHQQHARLSGSDREGYLKINKYEPEYYFAEREHALYCNLVDARSAEYVPDIIIERALKFIDDELEQDRKVFITCNAGTSRSPSIAFMYLIRNDYFSLCDTFEEAMKFFKKKYPLYSPNQGFYDYTSKFFYDHKGGNDKWREIDESDRQQFTTMMLR